MPPPKSPRLLFVVNVDWFFLSHRLSLALAAKNAGYDVLVAAADTGDGKTIEAHGLKFIPIPFSRKGTRLSSEMAILPRIFQLYRKLKPDLVHHVSIKPVIYGTMVSRLFPKIAVVNAIPGMGFVFSGDAKADKLRHLVKAAYRIALGKKHMRVIFQNDADRNAFIQDKLIRQHKAVLIRGSGVDCNLFKPKPGKQKTETPIVLLASRRIRDKGIPEFVEAAAIVKADFPQARFVLAGMVDEGNPNAINAEELKSWQIQGHVEWWGHCENMVELISNATIVTLPTYYPEGVPRILIEAAACGKPIVTTNRPGCSDIVRDGINGLLIPEKDAAALAHALLTLLKSPELCDQYGKEGRKLTVAEFSEEIVVGETLRLYREMLNAK